MGHEAQWSDFVFAPNVPAAARTVFTVLVGVTSMGVLGLTGADTVGGGAATALDSVVSIVALAEILSRLI